MRRLLILLLVCCLPFTGWAQLRSDSLHSVLSPACHSSHAFSAKQVILPTTLIAVGTTGFLDPVKEWDVKVYRSLSTISQSQRLTFDNYIQYVPAVSAVGLGWIGADAQHVTIDRLLLTGTSYTIMSAVVQIIKHSIPSTRPFTYEMYYERGNPWGYTVKNHPSSFNSFPSGHSATAFLGAELVRLEYGKDNPWLAVGAYTIAAGTGFLRIYNEKHWVTDVIAGAGIGIASARIGWWLLPFEQRVMTNLFGESFLRPTDKPKKEVTVCPLTDGHSAELAFSMSF